MQYSKVDMIRRRLKQKLDLTKAADQCGVYFVWHPQNKRRLPLRFGGQTELVQHFAYRGNLQRRKGAASHIIDMVWLYHLLIPEGRRGVFYLYKIISTFFRGVYRGRGGRSQHPMDFNLVACLIWLVFVLLLQIPSRCWWRLSWTRGTCHSGGRGCTWR